MMKKRLAYLFISTLCMLIICVGCGKNAKNTDVDINGVWESYQIIDVTGTVHEKGELDMIDTFVIEDDHVKYSSSLPSSDEVYEERDYIIEKNKDGTYNFLMQIQEGSDPLLMEENVKFDDDTMTMEIAGYTFIYKKL